MNALFDSAALAIVAYAHVDGASGASTGTNSGVVTTKQSTGLYSVALSTVMAQECDRDLILVQPTSTATQAAAMSNVIDGSMATKLVLFGNGTTAVDTSFAIVILRTMIPPPAGAPA